MKQERGKYRQREMSPQTSNFCVWVTFVNPRRSPGNAPPQSTVLRLFSFVFPRMLLICSYNLKDGMCFVRTRGKVINRVPVLSTPAPLLEESPNVLRARSLGPPRRG